MSSTSRPWGVVLCAAAALVFAAPTVLLPSDSPTGPKLIFVAVGSVILIFGAIRIRREGGAGGNGQASARKEDPRVSEE